MAYGAARFMGSGWVETLYDEPTFYFKFYGFGWVPEVSGLGAYALYSVIFLSALGIAFGAFYRVATVVFFLSFSWAELMDATNYLNHYYLVCLLSFLLIFMPAHRFYSFDAWRNSEISKLGIPKWCRPAIMLQLAIVYFFAGLAKLNTDWLFNAMPLAVWLPTKADFPVLGPLFAQQWTAYAFSWFGAFYDLTIVGWLLWKPTRNLAYVAVLAFHLLTWLLFNIGLFPLIMMTSTLIFFPAESGLMQTAKQLLSAIFGQQPHVDLSQQPDRTPAQSGQSAAFWESFHGSSRYGRTEKMGLVFNSSQRLPLVLFFAIQLLLPLRSLAYPGSTYWTEEGYRFGWRVMLVEKSGQATFYVHDPETGRQAEVDNREFLTKFQEKQMAIQPDFILQYAHYLAQVFGERYGIQRPKVTADVFVALNGRPSARLIDPSVDLAAETDHLFPKSWILQLPKE